MPYALSGLTLGNISKSEERTKKFPWKECIATPRVQRSLKRASKPILRDRYRSKQFIKRVTIVGDLTLNWGKLCMHPDEYFDIPAKSNNIQIRINY